MFLIIRLLVGLFRRSFAFTGLAMIVLAFMMGANAITGHHTMAVQVRESYWFFASYSYFLGFASLSLQVVIETKGGAAIMAELICLIHCIMAGWVLIGPFVGYPFLGLTLFVL